MIGVKRPACAAFAEHVNNLPLTSVPGPVGGDIDEYEMKQFQYVYEKLRLDQLCPVNEMCAETFLINLLKRRGHSFVKRSAFESPFKRPIRSHEIENYSKDLLNAISGNDIAFVQDLCRKQKRINACNQVGESTLHMAARKSCHQIVNLILKSEEEKSPLMIDDYGRSPLTDALCAISPSFSVIEQLLDHSVDLLYLTDDQGFTPLNYVRKEYVIKLCLFFYSRREKYWPLRRESKRIKVANEK